MPDHTLGFQFTARDLTTSISWLMRPTHSPRCRCGQLTRWHWDDDEEESGDVPGWRARACWRCSQLALMAFEMACPSLSGAMKLTDDQAGQFVRLLTDPGAMRRVVRVKAWPRRRR